MNRLILSSLLVCAAAGVFGRAVVSDADRHSFGPLTPSAVPHERQYLWPEGKMPHAQEGQIAAKSDDANKPGFDRAANRRPYLEWYRPAASDKTDVCVLVVSGGGFYSCCDAARLQPIIDRLVAAGVTVANLTYRTPRPKGLPIHQSALEDVQRAIRVVRSEAAARGFSPDKIGATGISAGAKAVLLAATSSQTRAYPRVDAIDDLDARLLFALPQAPAYVLTDGDGEPNRWGGDGPGVDFVPDFAFDAATCSMCFVQGGDDVYSPLGSTRLWRKLRAMGRPAELHLFADRWHGFHGDANRGADGTGWDHWIDRVFDYLRACGWLPAAAQSMQREAPAVSHESRFVWHAPSNRTTRAVQILLAPSAVCRAAFFSRGVTVVDMDAPAFAQTDAVGRLAALVAVQRAVRAVRVEAPKRGLDPNRIGVAGAGETAVVALLAATSSRRCAGKPSTAKGEPVSAAVQWAAVLAPDDSFDAASCAWDRATCPVVFVADCARQAAAEKCVTAWERLRAIGVQGDLHVLAAPCAETELVSRAFEFLNHERLLVE